MKRYVLFSVAITEVHVKDAVIKSCCPANKIARWGQLGVIGYFVEVLLYANLGCASADVIEQSKRVSDYQYMFSYHYHHLSARSLHQQHILQ